MHPSAPKNWGLCARRSALLLAIAAASVVTVAKRSGHQLQTSALEAPPKMVAWLNKEARKNVEDDTTKAGLKALDNKDSLAATLTGGLKKTVEEMNAGDTALLHEIIAKASKGTRRKASPAKAKAKKAVSVKAAKLKAGARGRAAGRFPPVPVMKNVVAVVMRDRKHEMASMSKALARVELLRKRLDAHGMGKPAVKHEVVVTVHSAGGQKISPAKEAVERATARALLIKSKELKKRSAQLKIGALFTALPKERALEAAMAKQKVIVNKLKKEDKIANGKQAANVQLAKAKEMSQKSIQELKQAGVLIKESNAIGSRLTPKQKAKLQKRSENLTEKAVHTMLVSRKMSKKAQLEIRQANAVVSTLPALAIKAKQAKLVLKVLEAQLKSDTAGLASNKGYQAAVKLSQRLVKEANKDSKMAKGLASHAAARGEHKAGITHKAAGLSSAMAAIVRGDKMRANQLRHLRLALAAEKRNVEDDDAILSALSNSGH